MIKEFVSYRNGAKRSYIAFVKRIYRTSASEYIAKTLASKSPTDFIINLLKIKKQVNFIVGTKQTS